MTGLYDGLLLHHGSYTIVSKPDLSKCARFKDFGRGFYLTSSIRHARSFARLSLRKARENGLVPKNETRGYVSSFRVCLTEKVDIEAHVFPSADTEWLKCVSAHRKKGAFRETLAKLRDYDMIIGKVANDQTNNTLTTFLSGGYGPYQSERAIRPCVELLLPNRLDDQYCFRTQCSLALLSFEGCEVVSP